MEATPTPASKPTLPPEEVKSRTAEIEQALKGVIKLLGSLRFYPAGHPALKETAREARASFVPLMRQRESVAFQIRRDSFAFDDFTVNAENPLLQKLAATLFARRIQRLTILPDLTPRDLWLFVQILALDPGELQKRGGAAEQLQQNRVTTVWVNEVDLRAILSRKEELEVLRSQDGEARSADPAGETESPDEELVALGNGGEEPPAAESPPGEQSPARELDELLQRLAAASDEDYQRQIPRLPALVRQNLNDNGRIPVLRALAHLGQTIQDPRAAQPRRTAARSNLTQLGGNDVIEFFHATLVLRSLTDEQRRKVMPLAPLLGESLALRLMAALAEENDASLRRVLSDTLVRMGTTALPAVLPYLNDERWYVIRNVVGILGDIRDQSVVERLPPHLHHHDLRVRRETIRALTRIGGDAAVQILLGALHGNDADLRRQAMLSLGAMKHPAAIDPLEKIILAPDFTLKHVDVKKDAIRTLGEIGLVDALPVLIEIVRRRRFFFSSRYNELRAAAVASLGEIGGAEAQAVVDAAINDAAPNVVRAAVQATKLLKKPKR